MVQVFCLLKYQLKHVMESTMLQDCCVEMGPRADEHLTDSQVIAENLLENIFNEALRAIRDRTDNFCFDSFESLKLHAFGSEDILEFTCPRRESLEKPKELKSQEVLGMNSFLNDICYPSLANLPEVCVHSSSISNTSKQGEGDFQHPKIREATAFYRLDTEVDAAIPCGSKDYRRNSPNSSPTSETSHNELIAKLKKDLDLSFENIQLSDVTDSEDGLHEPILHFGPKSPSPCLEESENMVDNFVAQKYDREDSVCGKNLEYGNSRMQQSQKFCQLNSDEYFPHSHYNPNHFSQVVNENNIPYTYVPDMREDEQELLSEGSEELVIITESEEDQVVHLANSEGFDSRNPFENPYFPSVKPSVMMLATPCSPENSEHDSQVSAFVKVASDVAATKEMNSWEESIEVQMNTTEPCKVTEKEDSDNEEVFQSRKYWSNVGLMSENKINPKFRGLVENPFGLESMLGVERVSETYLERQSQEKFKDINIDESEEQKELGNKTAQNKPNECLKEKDKIDHLLTQTDKSEKGRKKKNLVSRLSTSFTNLFKSKKKNQKS